MHLSFFPLKKEVICSSYTKLPNAFLQLNVKTKIPLLKKKKKYGELADCIFICQPSENMATCSANSPGKLLRVTSYVFYAFHFVPSIPVLHPLAYIKPQTSQEQATAVEQL